MDEFSKEPRKVLEAFFLMWLAGIRADEYAWLNAIRKQQYIRFCEILDMKERETSFVITARNSY